MIYEVIPTFDSTARQPDGSASQLDGNLSAGLQSTGGIADRAKLLLLLVSPSVLCIGLNNRKRVEEAGANHPDSPLMFFKAPPCS